MGYFRDEHLIIEGKDTELVKLRKKIISLLAKEFEGDWVDYSNYVSPVLSGLANGYSAIFLPADGSKEGWSTSNSMDDVRGALREYIIKHNAKANGLNRFNVILVTVDEGSEAPSVEYFVKPGY